MKRMGSLWSKEDKNGNTYYTGVIEPTFEETRIIVFRNLYKKSENSPDYIIYEQEAKKNDNA